MSRILSQDEVRALLQQPEGGESDPSTDRAAQHVTRYDFRDQVRMPRAGLRPLRFLHDRFVQHLSVSLSAFLRNGTEVQLENIEQLSSRRFLQGLSDPTAIFMVDSTVGGALALVIDNELALVLVDRLLGGPVGKPTLERALTEIEQSVLEGLVEIVLMGLKQVWSPTLDVTLSIRLDGRSIGKTNLPLET